MAWQWGGCNVRYQGAVVIGAGMGGLAAAKAIAPYFERAIVLDRDALPETPAPRVGTPQTRHVHTLLASGEKALEELFPGIRGDFGKAGAVIIRGGCDLVWERPGYTHLPAPRSGIRHRFLASPSTRKRLPSSARGNAEHGNSVPHAFR